MKQLTEFPKSTQKVKYLLMKISKSNKFHFCHCDYREDKVI